MDSHRSVAARTSLCWIILVVTGPPPAVAADAEKRAAEDRRDVEASGELPLDVLQKKSELFKASAKVAAKRADREAAIGQYLSLIDQAIVDLGPKEAAAMTALEVRSVLVFLVLGDGKTLWRSDPVTACGTSKTCRASVEEIDVLELRVQCKGANHFAGAAWLDPKVLR